MKEMFELIYSKSSHHILQESWRKAFIPQHFVCKPLKYGCLHHRLIRLLSLSNLSVKRPVFVFSMSLFIDLFPVEVAFMV